MTLLSIVLALILSAHSGANIQNVLPTLFEKYLNVLIHRFSTRWTLFFFVVPVAFLVLLIQWFFIEEPGLVALLFGALILTNCINYGELASFSKNLAIASKAQDRNTIQSIANNLGVADDNQGRLQQALLTTSFSQLFLPLFWFSILGPLGAILCLQFELASAKLKSSSFNRGTIEFPPYQKFLWLPARFLILSFALLTDFDEVMKQYRTVAEQKNISTKGLIGETTVIALDKSCASKELHSTALTIIKKTLILWLALLAILTIGSWIN